MMNTTRPRKRQSLEMIDIPHGIYRCGTDNGFWNEAPEHTVNLSHPYFIAAQPVTNHQFEMFDPSHGQYRGVYNTPAGDEDPVRCVTWQEAVSYCEWLSHSEGTHYRLPTEAEWEIAFTNQPHKLKGGREVENWCMDWYGPYMHTESTDPIGFKTGDSRVVRGGSWRAPEGSSDLPSVRTRLGALPDDRNPAVGFRVVKGHPLSSTPSTDRPVPIWAQDVSTTGCDWKASLQTSEPFFGTPIPYVLIPPGSNGPLFSHHNHDPALVSCRNGDLLAVWYTTVDETGRELNIAGARLRRGCSVWDSADLFWAVPGRDNHAPALWADEHGTLFHFNGIAAEGGWYDLALLLRISTDNGKTWTPARFLSPHYHHGNQAIPSPFRSSEGSIYLPCDASPLGQGGSLLHTSSDGGTSWSVLHKGADQSVFAPGGTGPWIAGIHSGIDQAADGSLVAVGRGDTIDGKLARSVSSDQGNSWHYSASPFPPIGGGQRPVLRRLLDGSLLLVSFTTGSMFRGADGKEFEGFGMFAALSMDGGTTWPYRRLLTDGVTRTLDGRGWTHDFTMDATHAEPAGYLAGLQTPDGMFHLISSGIYYHFNAAWIREARAVEL